MKTVLSELGSSEPARSLPEDAQRLKERADA
jgi:hypothetical protein